jgi:hypothetical protein
MIRNQGPRNKAHRDATRWIIPADTPSKSNGQASDLPWKLRFTSLRAFDVDSANYGSVCTPEKSIRRGTLLWK